MKTMFILWVLATGAAEWERLSFWEDPTECGIQAGLYSSAHTHGRQAWYLCLPWNRDPNEPQIPRERSQD